MIRNKVPWCILLLFIISVPLCGQTEPQKYALVIGINEYISPDIQQVSPLQFAEQDAKVFYQILEKQGYDVTLITEEASRRTIILNLYKLAKKAKKQDMVLIFFAGHGWRDKFNSQTYWLTHYAELKALDVEAIRLKHLMDYVEDIKAEKKLILLDHCFSGDIVNFVSGADDSGSARSGDGLSTATTTEIELADRMRGEISREEYGKIFEEIKRPKMWIIAGARDFAYESKELKHGIFTKALIEAFTTSQADTNKNLTLEIGELITYLRLQVPKLAAEFGPLDVNAPEHQKIQTYRMEMNGDEYQVAINLPPPDKEIEEEKIKQYKMKIMEWGDMRYIDPDSPTFLAIWSTLVEWKDAIDENRQLQSSLKEKIDRLIEEMERPGPDKIKADRLKIRFSIPG